MVRHQRPIGAEQPVLSPPLLRCNCFAFGLYPVLLTVIARTRIDAGKLVAVRRALCASEYGGVTRILVWYPATVTHEVSTERFASVARTEGSALDGPSPCGLTVFIPLQAELLEPHGRDESLDALLAAPDGWHHEYRADRNLVHDGPYRSLTGKEWVGRRSPESSG